MESDDEGDGNGIFTFSVDSLIVLNTIVLTLVVAIQTINLLQYIHEDFIHDIMQYLSQFISEKAGITSLLPLLFTFGFRVNRLFVKYIILLQ